MKTLRFEPNAYKTQIWCYCYASLPSAVIYYHAEFQNCTLSDTFFLLKPRLKCCMHYLFRKIPNCKSYCKPSYYVTASWVWSADFVSNLWPIVYWTTDKRWKVLKRSWSSHLYHPSLPVIICNRQVEPELLWHQSLHYCLRDQSNPERSWVSIAVLEAVVFQQLLIAGNSGLCNRWSYIFYHI